MTDLVSSSFLESVLLLLITAALTGFLVPMIKSKMDDRKFKEQKAFEAELARQNKIIESQVKLLEDISKLIWDFCLMALEVSYYKIMDNPERFQEACKKYDDNAWEFFSKIRPEISKALRLTSPEVHEALQQLYYECLIPLDARLANLIKSNSQKQDWEALHEFIRRDVAQKVDDVINFLAKTEQLSYSNNDRNSGTEKLEM